MKKTAYIRLTDAKPTVNKSILKKAADAILGTKDPVPLYTISGIYDERLVKTGVLVEYYLKDNKDTDVLEKYHSDITRIARSEECEYIAFEDHTCVYDYPHEYTDGTEYILRYEINDLKQAEPGAEKNFVGVVISKETSYAFVKMIADEFRYIMLYSKDRSLTDEYAEYIMQYNSTAVISSNALKNLYEIPVIFSLDPFFSEKPKDYNGTFLCPYRKFSDQPEEVRFHAYTDKFSDLALSAAFCEVCNGRLNTKWLD